MDTAAKLAKATHMNEDIVRAAAIPEDKMTAMFNKIASYRPYMTTSSIAGAALILAGIGMEITGGHSAQPAMLAIGFLTFIAGALSTCVSSVFFDKRPDVADQIRKAADNRLLEFDRQAKEGANPAPQPG
jgi:hypothetical protein